jgi:hypothetical protein
MAATSEQPAAATGTMGDSHPMAATSEQLTLVRDAIGRFTPHRGDD